ncbi:DEKNAAC105285 [Brettanomyces naardenensis]|uniref:DNA helicase n=1 Tax=Brettanomyces naardenensis TaxID=13370 RepID=A0A448YSZ3_BRENA|nr:DEKNAAC105285 [Brettanomyces naardenensis]
MVVREIINISDDDSGSDTNIGSSSSLQVPDSSPLNKRKVVGGGDVGGGGDSDLSSPVKPIIPTRTVRLSSLNEKFAYRGMTGGAAVVRLPGMSREQSQDFQVLERKFPNIPQARVLSVFRRQKNLRDASRVLESISGSMRPLKMSKPLLRAAVPHLSPSDRVKLSSPVASPIKDRDVVSSRVTLKNGKSILERFGNSRRSITRPSPYEFDLDDEPVAQKKRRLVRGSNRKGKYEEDSSFFTKTMGRNDVTERAQRSRKGTGSVVEIDSDSEDEEDRRQRRELQKEKEEAYEEGDYDLDQDVESDRDEDGGLDFDERVLKFLNTADIRDIVDIANVKPTAGQILIDGRPYSSYEEIENKDFEDNTKKTSRKKPLGEKIVETTMRKLRGYEMVESLVTECKSYGDQIKKEIEKWGVGVDGESGELEITKVDAEESEEADSEDGDDIQVIASRVADSGDDDEMSDISDNFDDEDYREKPVSITKKRGRKYRTTGYFTKRPKLMAPDCKLKDYQQVGVNWLSLLYRKDLSCILADEMGLGKTIEVIAFLAHLKEVGFDSPHLIVVPASTLENWLREFQKFAPSLDVRPYYGSQAAREELRMDLEDDNTYDVLVTTYSMATGNKYDQAFLRSRKFNVIVYDEGHMLKNSASNRYQKLMRLRGQFRLLLTGTPLQNNLRELISLLSFILPQVFNEKKSELEDLFDQKTTTNASNGASKEDLSLNPLLSQQAIKRARTMMTPFVLRRKKDQVMKHLPAKHNHILYCDLTPVQRDIYEDSLADARYRIRERRRRKGLKAEELAKLPKLDSVSGSNYLMALRKACLHPMLFRYLYDDEVIRTMAKKIRKNPQYYDSNEQYIYEDMTVMSDFELNQLCHSFPKQLEEFVLPVEFYMHSSKVQKMMEIVEQVLEKGEKVLVFTLFTQLLDILEKVMSFKNIKFVRLDGTTAVDERQNVIDRFYEDKAIPVFLLSTKAGGFGINLVAATNVIIFDMSFNPHDDKQAEDRAHRVGQTKDVNVYRLVCRDTIEENILQVAYNKLELDTSMMTGGKDVEELVIKEIDETIESKENGEVKEEAGEHEVVAVEAPTPPSVPPTPSAKHGILAQTVKEESDGEMVVQVRKSTREHIKDPEYCVDFPLDFGESAIHIPSSPAKSDVSSDDTPLEIHSRELDDFGDAVEEPESPVSGVADPDWKGN